MNWDMSIKGRLMSLAGLALLGICALGALATGSNQVNQRALTRLYDQDIESLVRMQQIEITLLEARFRAAAVLLDQMPIPGSLNHVREARQEITTLWTEFEPRAVRGFSKGEALEHFSQLKDGWSLVDSTLAKLEQGYLAKDKEALTAVLEDQWPNLHKRAVKPLEALIRITQKAAGATYVAANEMSRVLLAIGLATAALCLIAISVVAWLITRSLMRTLGAEPSVAANIVQRVAAGDLSVRINLKAGDTTSLVAQLKTMQDSLALTVGGVRQTADALAAASTQIAQGNNDLSARTEQQATALQETAASMEELGSSAKQTADNAQQANRLALDASGVATRGGKVVSQVVDTMKGINDSSKKIADIISIIDGIAFQTNILALNAAVEAARAGEQGRGFAVVASEVRSLAGRSADAAKEIKSLVTASVERVGQGTALVDQAGATMTELVNSIKRVTDIMGEISTASAEQSAGVAQVGQAVSQMDQATQQNAAFVDERRAAAESLNGQAQKLVQAVAVFKLAQGEVAHQGGVASAPNPATVERRSPDRAKNMVRPAFGTTSKTATAKVAGTATTSASVKTGTDDWSSI